MEIQEEVKDGKEVLDPDDTNSVLNTALNPFNNESEH